MQLSEMARSRAASVSRSTNGGSLLARRMRSGRSAWTFPWATLTCLCSRPICGDGQSRKSGARRTFDGPRPPERALDEEPREDEEETDAAGAIMRPAAGVIADDRGDCEGADAVGRGPMTGA